MAKFHVTTWAKYNYAEEESTFNLERKTLAEAVALVQKYLDLRSPDESKITSAREVIEF